MTYGERQRQHDKGQCSDQSALLEHALLVIRLLVFDRFRYDENAEKCFYSPFFRLHLPILAQRHISELRRHKCKNIRPQVTDNEAEEHAGDGRGVELVYAIGCHLFLIAFGRRANIQNALVMSPPVMEFFRILTVLW